MTERILCNMNHMIVQFVGFLGLGHGGILIHISGQCASGTCDNLEASTMLTCVYAETASRASPVIPGIWEIVSEKFPAAICEAEAPCSANTALYPHSSLTLSHRSTTRHL